MLSPTLTDILYSAAALVISVLSAGVLIPQILLISFRRNLFDVPDERKIHQGAVPRLGGIAFKPVVCFAIALLLGIDMMAGGGSVLDSVASEGRTLSFAFCSIMMLYLVGMADDLIGIRYRAKFVVQIACGLLMISGGLWIGSLYGLFGIHAIPAWIGAPLTVFAVVFIINSINLIDGIDGLASGLSAVVMFFYGIIFLMMQQHVYALLSFATLGVLIPFFYYNVFGEVERMRKIFMGDTGSLTIGMIICILSLRLMKCTGSGALDCNGMVLAYSPLIVPCFDVVRVYIHRVRNGSNPFLPDKNHIHHKLLAIGMRQHTAMIAIILVSGAFTLLNIVLSPYVGITLLLGMDVLIWTVWNILLTSRIKAAGKD